MDDLKDDIKDAGRDLKDAGRDITGDGNVGSGTQDGSTNDNDTSTGTGRGTAGGRTVPGTVGGSPEQYVRDPLLPHCQRCSIIYPRSVGPGYIFFRHLGPIALPPGYFHGGTVSKLMLTAAAKANIFVL